MNEKEAVEYLRRYSELLKALRDGGVVRSFNSPVGDFVEWLVCRRLGLELQRESEKGFDAKSPTDGKRYQIKGVWRYGGRKHLRTSPLRNYDEHSFDELIIVVLAEDFKVEKVLSVPHCVVGDYYRPSRHINAISVVLTQKFLSDCRIKDITSVFNREVDDGAN